MVAGQSTSDYIPEDQIGKDILNSSVLDMLSKKMLNHLKNSHVLQQPANHYPYLKHLNLDNRHPDNETPNYRMAMNILETIPDAQKETKSNMYNFKLAGRCLDMTVTTMQYSE